MSKKGKEKIRKEREKKVKEHLNDEDCWKCSGTKMKILLFLNKKVCGKANNFMK